ncbi:LysR family transcriptional regulator [Leucobacter allii]|uniref:LysR family transcriptional regulator n=1 Tax=Leucobacter allii TaxID=2932247 RepID=A0ABY4FM69_9MICO|nr:LysR family transcriptional regulator [Leucobacter allii]UOQ57377.1 LysR family transcriptional regulator [Leucobacter allii]UOR01825.1 LysR family transcriptional regulator [Leucobacter allii]
MDLNLIRVFVAVHETRSITLAATRLYVTPPAVSQSLAKLRGALDDRLFERVGRRMHPTPVADELYPEFRDALLRIERAVDGLGGFDPGASERSVRIALSELGEIGWLPGILRAVRARAPRMSLEVVPLDPAELPDWLSRGVVDLAVTPAELPAGFESTLIKTQGYGVAMSAQNPLAEGELTLERYVAAAHVKVAGDSGIGHLEAALRHAGAQLVPRVVASRVAALPAALAADPELIATVPDTIAEGWAATWPLAIRPLPFDMRPLAVRLYRRRTAQHPAALDWLFDTVARAIRGSSGQFEVIHGRA